MRLYTIQPESIYKEILQFGSYKVDKEISEYSDGTFFKNAYDWMIGEMNKRIVHPDKFTLPIWAWYKYDGQNEYPDINKITFGKNKCLIEIEIDSDKIVLSDYNKWHAVLNNAYYHYKETDEDWDAEQKRFDELPSKERELIKKQSWQDIFNIENCKYVQATFYDLNRNMIKSVQKINDIYDLEYIYEDLLYGKSFEEIFKDTVIDCNNMNELNIGINNYILNKKNTYMHRMNIKDEFDLLDKVFLSIEEKQMIDFINNKITQEKNKNEQIMY